MALDTESQPLQTQQQQPPPPPPPQMSMEQDIEYIMHRLTSWGFHRSILTLDEELRAMHTATAPAAAAAAALRSPPPPSGLPPPPAAPTSTLPPPPAAAAAAAADRPGFETYPNVPASVTVESATAAAEPVPPMPAHYASVSADIEALEEHLLGVGAAAGGADGAAAAEANDEPCFLRIAPRDPRFFEEELWAPDQARPAFARGAGITAEEYRLHMSDVAEEKHRAALQDAVRSFAPEEEVVASPQPASPTRDDAVSDCDEADATPASPAVAEEALSPQAPEVQQQQQQQQQPADAAAAFGGSPPPPSAAAPAPAEAAQQAAPPPPESHPPAPPQLEKFSLQVIYTKGKTGFEQERNFPMDVNSVIAGRYQILEYIGGAAFSHAVQCLDLKTNHPVCVKIIKNSKDFFDQSLDEIKLLQYINRHGDADEHCVLQLYDYFYYKEHLFLVSELLRENLYEFSKFNRLRGDDLYFTVQRLQKITKQVLTALSYIHRLNLVHCDLKPENILIRSFSRCEVKVIDFGSSCFTHDHLSSYVQSRCYRAPEVVLGLPYGQGIDLWSLGAILPELLTGHVLFYNDSVNTMLTAIASVCGPFPAEMLANARHAHSYLTRSGVFYEQTKQGIELLFPRRTSLRKRTGCDDDLFIDFVSKLLEVDPSKRPTAEEALRHPWLQVDYGPIPALS